MVKLKLVVKTRLVMSAKPNSNQVRGRKKEEAGITHITEKSKACCGVFRHRVFNTLISLHFLLYVGFILFFL